MALLLALASGGKVALTEPVNMARMVRAFPTKKLADDLYMVIADGNTLNQKLTAILVDPPTLPAEWCQALQELDGLLWSLEDNIKRAHERIAEHHADTDRAFDAAVSAVTAMLRGAGFAADVPVSPEEDEEMRDA